MYNNVKACLHLYPGLILVIVYVDLSPGWTLSAQDLRNKSMLWMKHVANQQMHLQEMEVALLTTLFFLLVRKKQSKDCQR